MKREFIKPSIDEIIFNPFDRICNCATVTISDSDICKDGYGEDAYDIWKETDGVLFLNSDYCSDVDQTTISVDPNLPKGCTHTSVSTTFQS